MIQYKVKKYTKLGLMGNNLFYTIKLASKNIFSRKSSIVIITFITIALCLLTISNSIFEGTDNGIKTVFKESFTGDLIIKSKDAISSSLFGTTNQYSSAIQKSDEIYQYTEICNYLSSVKEIKTYTPQLSTFAMLEFNDYKKNSAIFGINAQEYVPIMKGITIEQGSIFKDGEKGILISKSFYEGYKKSTGNEIQIGDIIQLNFTDGATFRIRAVPVSGIFSYPTQNDLLDKIMLVDPQTVRSLLGMNIVIEDNSFIEEESINLISSLEDNFDDMDSLFSEVSDTVVKENTTNLLEEKLIDKTDLPQKKEATNWNFIIVKVNDKVSVNKIINKINHFAKKNNYSITAVDWRKAAGSTALYIFWLRTIIIIGIAIILFAGLIVITNTLVINVLDRTREIGTMRAIGANKKSISVLCMIETFILTFISAIISFIISTIFIIILINFPIHLSNPFFIQLFGGNKIIPTISFSIYFQTFLLSIILGLLTWIYPVVEALKISPLKAMKGGI